MCDAIIVVRHLLFKFRLREKARNVALIEGNVSREGFGLLEGMYTSCDSYFLLELHKTLIFNS